MSDTNTQPAPAPKRIMRYVRAEMDPEVRASAGLRHVTVLERWRLIKEAKKSTMKDFTDKLDMLDEQALSLERATRARDGEEVQLPMPCKEVPLWRDEARRWELAVYQINIDPLTGEETEVFHAWEDLPEEFAHLNQGTLWKGGGPGRGPGGGSGGATGKDKGSSDRDAVKDVDFPDEDDQAEPGGGGSRKRGGE